MRDLLKQTYNSWAFRLLVDAFLLITALGYSVDGSHYTAVFVAFCAGLTWHDWE